jgi:hypothetical protein
MQVSMKPMVKEVWDNLMTRFVDADCVKVARLATLKGKFDKLIMENTEPQDDYAGKISSMAVRYVEFDATLGDASMVKKLLDTVPDRLFELCVSNYITICLIVDVLNLYMSLLAWLYVHFICVMVMVMIWSLERLLR